MTDSSDSSEETERESTSSRSEFERALDDLSREEIERRKFGEASADDGDSDGATRDDRASPPDRPEGDPEDQAVSEPPAPATSTSEAGGVGPDDRRVFERAMRDVDELDSSTTDPSEAQPPDPSDYFEDQTTRESPSDELVTPRLGSSPEHLKRAPPLDGAQQALVDRLEAVTSIDSIPELNLRGRRRDPALDALVAFTREHAHSEERFGRVVHGRGRRSTGAPVLKPAVVEWIERRGRSYVRGHVPERQPSGAWGSILLEFRDVDPTEDDRGQKKEPQR